MIGHDATCADKESSVICNGQLKPASKYRVKIRVYTSPTLWTDTLYSDSIETGISGGTHVVVVVGRANMSLVRFESVPLLSQRPQLRAKGNRPFNESITLGED